MVDTLQTEPVALNWEESMRILDILPQCSMEDRADKVSRLLRNPSPGIRQRALRIGVAVLSDDQLIEFIRNDADDVIRNAGLEIFKLKGSRSFTIALNLLQDKDPDVVLQAILLLDHISDPRAYNYLRPLLSNSNTNLVQAAITAVGHLGNARAIRDLLPFLKADPWLQIAAVQALGDIRSSQAIKPLQELLTDLFLSSLAAEAIARIGGSKAFSVLAEHWMKFHENLEAESVLELLAHVLEGLKKKPVVPKDLLKNIYPYLSHALEKIRLAAARCVLICGPCTGDQEALLILVHPESPEELPACVQGRADLVTSLVKMKGLPRIWGLQLTSLSPKGASLQEVIKVIESEEAVQHPDVVMRCLKKIKNLRTDQMRNQRLAETLCKLYVRLPIMTRPLLIPLLRPHKSKLKYFLDQYEDIDKEMCLVMKSFLGGSARKVACEVIGLPANSRPLVLSQITNKSVYKNLPWKQWLTEEPETYAPVAAQIASNAKMHELLPLLRNVLLSFIHPDIIRCFGELRYRESIPVLMDCRNRSPQLVRALIIETIGKIGGPESRKALHEDINKLEGKEASLAYRALSHCAIEDDSVIFRQAIEHPDWMVRLACAEVFGRFPNAEDIEYLTRLASDPVNAVSQRARELLEA